MDEEEDDDEDEDDENERRLCTSNELEFVVVREFNNREE